MTALLLLAVAAAITAAAALTARRRRRPAYVGRHTEASIERLKAKQRDQKRTDLAQLGIPPEEADAMGPSGVFRAYQRASVTAPQQAIKELTGRRVA